MCKIEDLLFSSRRAPSSLNQRLSLHVLHLLHGINVNLKRVNPVFIPLNLEFGWKQILLWHKTKGKKWKLTIRPVSESHLTRTGDRSNFFFSTCSPADMQMINLQQWNAAHWTTTMSMPWQLRAWDTRGNRCFSNCCTIMPAVEESKNGWPWTQDFCEGGPNAGRLRAFVRLCLSQTFKKFVLFLRWPKSWRNSFKCYAWCLHTLNALHELHLFDNIQSFWTRIVSKLTKYSAKSKTIYRDEHLTATPLLENNTTYKTCLFFILSSSLKKKIFAFF